MGLIDIQSCNQPGQLPERDIHHIFLILRPFEMIFFKPFLPKAETILIPV